MLRGQVTLIRTVPIDDRLSAAFLGEFILDDKDVSEDIFNEIQSNKQMCSMPKNQTFKCNVYKNGEIIGNL